MGKDLKGKELGAGFCQRASDKRYVKRFYYENKQYSVYGSTLKECKQNYNKKIQELEDGFTSKKVVFAEYFDKWIQYREATGKVKGSTLSIYKTLNRLHIEPVFGKMRCDRITPKDVQAFQLRLSEKYSPETVNSITDILHLVMERAVKDETILRNPVLVDHISKEKGAKRTNNRALTIDEMNMFIKYSEKSFFYNAIRMLFATGMRQGELRGLRWSDYDEKNGVLHIRRTASIDKDGNPTMNTPKSNSGLRDLPLNDDIKRIIKDQRDQQLALFGNVLRLDGYMFTSTTGKVVSRNALKNAFNQISERIQKDGFDFDRISPHACRHTFITVNLYKGENQYAVKAFVGHAMNASVTEATYTGVEIDKVKEMIKHNNMGDSKVV